MLESRKEMVALESSLSSSSTKRSPFHLLSSIFSKKKQSILENEAVDKAAAQSGAHHLDKLVNDFSDTENSSTAPSYSNDPDFWGNPMEFESPILKTRRKNLRIDLETLHQSRQDNPYLKQLECFTGSKEALLSFALAETAQAEWRESDVDIHQHLVRSPPPQFPQNLSHFMYSQANSPKRYPTKTESCENVEPGGNKKSKSLNPVQSKWEVGMLDPGIREVLEYQKSQLRAGLNDFHGGRAKLGTAPTHYTLSDRFTSFDSRDMLLRNSGTRPSKPAATVSLPNYLDLEQTLKKIPLGPLRIGRTLSDSICHDNKFNNKTLRQ